MYHRLFWPLVLPYYRLFLVKMCVMQRGLWLLISNYNVTLITMMTSSQKTQRVVKMTCALVICEGTLGYKTYPTATSSHIPLSPSKEITGLPYKERR